MRDINVLITGCGAPGAPGIIKSLKKNGERHINITGVDMNEQCFGFSMVDNHYIVPCASNRSFIKSIYGICLMDKIDVILPLVTKELLKFSRNKKRFEDAGIKVCVSQMNILKIANNKGSLLQFLEKKGMEVPKYKIVNTLKEFCDAFYSLGYPDLPVCFKPVVSNGSRGFRIVDEKKDMGYLLFNEKPDSTYISFKEIIKILKNMKVFPKLIVMEYLPGEEYSIDVLADNGKCIYIIPRRRDKMLGGISTIGTVVKNNAVINYTSQIIKNLKCSGNIGIQVRNNSGNYPMILEINPRVQGTIVLCTAAGINMPYYGIKLALGEKIPKSNINWGTKVIRYFDEVFYDDNGYAFTL